MAHFFFLPRRKTRMLDLLVLSLKLCFLFKLLFFLLFRLGNFYLSTFELTYSFLLSFLFLCWTHPINFKILVIVFSLLKFPFCSLLCLCFFYFTSRMFNLTSLEHGYYNCFKVLIIPTSSSSWGWCLLIIFSFQVVDIFMVLWMSNNFWLYPGYFESYEIWALFKDH